MYQNISTMLICMIYIYYIYSITKQLKKNKLFNLQLYKLKYKK